MAAKNPLAANPGITERFRALSPDSRAALLDFLRWLRRHARVEAETSWRRSKAPMAVYWKAVAAWSFHLCRIINSQPQPPAPGPQKEEL